MVRILKGCAGAAIVEAAIALPVLLIFVGAILDLGKGSRDANVSLEATRHAARIASQNTTNFTQSPTIAAAAGCEYLSTEFPDDTCTGASTCGCTSGSDWTVCACDGGGQEDSVPLNALRVEARATQDRSIVSLPYWSALLRPSSTSFFPYHYGN